jgi:hypothetical protein
MKEFLRKAFPFLSAAASAAGPIGAAGAAVLGAVIGKDVKPEQLETELTKLTMTEEGRLKALEAEQKFALDMRKLNFEHAEEIERIAAQDRASARDREKIVKDLTPKVLAYSIIGLFGAVVISTLFGWAKVDTVMAGTLVGYCAAKAEQIVSYYFGSSSGSAEKTKLLSDGNGNGNGHSK